MADRAFVFLRDKDDKYRLYHDRDTGSYQALELLLRGPSILASYARGWAEIQHPGLRVATACVLIDPARRVVVFYQSGIFRRRPVRMLYMQLLERLWPEWRFRWTPGREAVLGRIAGIRNIERIVPDVIQQEKMSRRAALEVLVRFFAELNFYQEGETMKVLKKVLSLRFSGAGKIWKCLNDRSRLPEAEWEPAEKLLVDALELALLDER